MRAAFSMVELIFVIVIIAILAAIAIPKLMATRDDAKIARTSHAIATAATEIASYTIAGGTIETEIGVYDMSKMSNMVGSLILSGDAKQDDLTVPRTDFKMGDTVDCISLQINDGILDANLSVSFSGIPDRLCRTLQEMFDPTQYPIPLKGSRVAQ